MERRYSRWGRACGLLVVGILVAGGSLGYAQGPGPGATLAVPDLNGSGPEVVPIETRAWAHDDFGRVVFDWPWAVAYGARIEGKTLTVMFDRRLHTTFQQIPRHLGAYITDVSLGPGGQSVVASLTDAYRLRTFLLNSENGGVKVVVDLLADGGAGSMLAQAPTLPFVEPSPEAVPGDVASPTISGDSPPLPPGLPFAAETDAAPESGENPPRPFDKLRATPPRRGAEEHPLLGGVPRQRRGGSAPAQSLPPDPSGEQTTGQDAEQAAAPPVEAVTEPAKGNPPRPFDKLRTTPPERGSEVAPSAESTPETVSEETPPVTTDPNPESPTPDQGGHPQGGAPTSDQVGHPQGGAPTSAQGGHPQGDAPTSDQAGHPQGGAPTSAQGGHPQGGAPAPNPQFPTLPVSVRIPVSQSRLFRLDTPVASVFVANPDIADVQLVSSGVLFVVAKAVGRTSVAALDTDSELVGEWTIATVLDIQPARAAIEGVPALKNVVVRQLNRGVELSGRVASIAVADLALRLTTTALPEETPVENRITVTGKQQVNLEVQIAEVQRSVSETLGFNWEVLPDIGSGRDLGMRVGRTFLNDAGKYITNSLPGGTAAALAGSTGISPGRTTVRGLIDALATAGLATVLARPNVTAVSGETASFFSGGEYPLPAGFEDGAIIFEYKKYGVLLDFVPTIIDSGRIMLTVRPEVSQRSDTDSLTVIGIDIPVINVRRAETTVEVGDGESIVIAGLYRDQSEAVEAGLPVVKDIPLLGMLFGTQSVRSNATELIVVVTARLTTATTMPRTTDRDRQLPGRRLRGYHY